MHEREANQYHDGFEDGLEPLGPLRFALLGDGLTDGLPVVDLVLGDEGGIDLSGDMGAQSWRIYCLDRQSGAVLWSKEPYSGEPRARRHVKSSHANPTPATDGESPRASHV